MLQERPVITLPADVFDALELSAFVYDGIGKHSFYRETRDGDVPCCIHGHAKSADNYTRAINSVLDAHGIGCTINDMIVSEALAAGAGNQRTQRITWAEYVKRGNIVRGAETEATNS